MEDLILRYYESIVLEPLEALTTDVYPLRVRFENVHEGTNHYRNAAIERWEIQKRVTGNQTALYRRGNETRLIAVVPEKAKPDSFEFEEHARTSTIRTFKIQKSDLLGWLPKENDTLEHEGKTYICRKTGTLKTFYQDIGNDNIIIRIYVHVIPTHH